MKYYLAFLERFPTISDLAAAPEDAVLETWQGLGYYSRARNLHATAKQIVQSFGGRFPETYSELIKLKGIGPYTAAAISSFAFNEDQVAVDGNVLRVISRVFNLNSDIRLPKTQNQFRELTASLLPSGQSYSFNQAMMELGAIICTPTKPQCGHCPVRVFCEAQKVGIQENLPFKSSAKSRRTRFLNYLLLESDSEFLFRKRGPKDIWEGLYEPILIESSFSFAHTSDFESAFPSFFTQISGTRLFPTTKHILSHQELHVTVLQAETARKLEVDGAVWVPANAISSLPKPIVFSKILGLKKGTPLPLSF